jgi:ketosteroid isomerase-like protein
MTDLHTVEQANASFYTLFENADIDGMANLWVNTEEVWCTHPGWPTIFGWDGIRVSFEQIFSAPELPQFLTSNVRIHGDQQTAWVFLEENLLGTSLSAVAAVNVFKKSEGLWHMVGHQAAPIIQDLDFGNQ